MEEALEEMCPKRKVKPHTHITSWWTMELDVLRKSLFTSLHKAQKSVRPALWDAYKAEKANNTFPLPEFVSTRLDRVFAPQLV